MADILLVHGSCHGAWTWRDTIPSLQALGHNPMAIDLPSHGDDQTPVNEVTLDDYAKAIITALSKPIVVVGHSMGGFPISLAAERRPDLFQHLIYLCAYIPQPGMTLAQQRRAAPRQPLIPAVQLAEDGKSFTVAEDMQRQVFYADCSDEQVEFARRHLSPQAVAPNEVPVALSARYAQVPRSYIRCIQDSAIPYEYQVTMTKGWPADRVVDMDTSHSPFFSAPDALAQHIDRFIRP